MAYDRKDAYYRKAKREGYRSRAAYKLLELARRTGFLRAGQRVLDLGCAPGGWLQVAALVVGPRGRIVGIDRLEVAPLGLAQVSVLQGDLENPADRALLRPALGGPADLVLSDMAPDTSGVGFADHANSVRLVRTAATVAMAELRPGGTFVAKVFDGPDLNELVSEQKSHYGKIRRVRPDATRKTSRELYLVCEDFRPAAPAVEGST